MTAFSPPKKIKSEYSTGRILKDLWDEARRENAWQPAHAHSSQLIYRSRHYLRSIESKQARERASQWAQRERGLFSMSFPLLRITFPLLRISFPLLRISFPLPRITFPLLRITFLLIRITFLFLRITFLFLLPTYRSIMGALTYDFIQWRRSIQYFKKVNVYFEVIFDIKKRPLKV